MRLERNVYFDIKRGQLYIYRQTLSLCSTLQGKAAHNEQDLSQSLNFPWKKHGVSSHILSYSLGVFITLKNALLFI